MLGRNSSIPSKVLVILLIASFYAIFYAGLAAAAAKPEAPQALREKKLPPSSFKDVEIAKLKKPRIVWLNLPLLEEMGFDVSKGYTPALERAVLDRYGWVAVDDLLDEKIVTKDRAQAGADFYGGGGLEDNVGSARAASFDDVQTKGIGKTPMLKSKSPYHTARSTLYESMKDAIWGEFTNHELPFRGNRIVALIDRHPSAKNMGSAEILEIRQSSLRVANYMRRKDKTNAADAKRVRSALEYLPEALPRPTSISPTEWADKNISEKIKLGLEEYAMRAGSQHGHMEPWGIYHGTNSQSNIELNGRLLDFVTATTQPGHAPVELLDDVLPFGHDYLQTRTSLIDRAVNEFESQNENIGHEIRKAFPRGAVRELRRVYDDAFNLHARRQVLERLGVPSHLISEMIEKHTAAADALLALIKTNRKKPVRIQATKIESLPESRLLKTIQKIHSLPSWSESALLESGIKSNAKEYSALLADILKSSSGLQEDNLRRAMAYKAGWASRPLEYLYFDDFRSFAAYASQYYEGGNRSFAKDTVDMINRASQRKVEGLRPFEVPVLMAEGNEGFTKELTTYDGATGEWNKIFYPDPGTPLDGLSDRLVDRSPNALSTPPTLEKVSGKPAFRVAVPDPEAVIDLSLLPLSGSAPAQVQFNTQKEVRCGTMFSKLKGAGKTGYVYVNDVLVTGENLYPMRVVRGNLGLSPREIKKLEGKSVLSVGEGHSGLLPMLQDKGVNATGLDLWYGQKNYPRNETGRLMKAYDRKHSDSLISGSAIRMPFPSNSYDEIVSHMLVNNLSHAQTLAYLREALRVVRPGGKVRTAGVEPNQLSSLLPALEAEFAGKAKISLKAKAPSWSVSGQRLGDENFLLTLEKP